MRVRKVSADDVKLYDLTQVKLKTAGTTQVAANSPADFPKLVAKVKKVILMVRL